MNLLVVTNTCSARKNIELNKIRSRNTLDPQQKFFRLFIEGMGQQADVKTTVLSALPVSASTVKQKKFMYEEEQFGNVSYHYIPFKNGKMSRYFSLVISTWREAKKWCKDNQNKSAAVIVDPLVPMIAIPSRIIAQQRGIKVGAIVTDIPSLCTSMKGRKESIIKTIFLHFYQRIADKDMFQYDFYIPLTESLNEVVNTSEKPYCIVEGFADSSDTAIENVHENYIMYAGGVYEKYGVKALVEAFIKLNRPDIELWIYGEGPYANEIKALNSIHPNVKYKGCVTSEEVVSIEKGALLLVNPRPTDEEFAKYSFPSKTMEYLLSGTPTASTNLPGIPMEYFEYLFSLGNGDKATIEYKLREILSKSKEDLLKKGKDGHDFVLEEKNNVKQSKKVVMLLETILRKDMNVSEE